jgi:hypothetical protein
MVDYSINAWTATLVGFGKSDLRYNVGLQVAKNARNFVGPVGASSGDRMTCFQHYVTEQSVAGSEFNWQVRGSVQWISQMY